MLRVKTSKGKLEAVDLTKIRDRLTALLLPEEKDVDVEALVDRVGKEIYDEITTKKLDELLAAKAFNKLHSRLGGAILVSRLHKETGGEDHTFTGLAKVLYEHETRRGKAPLISKETLDDVNELHKNHPELNDVIKYERDYGYTYMGIQTLIKSYLLKDDLTGLPLERPQDMLMRVAICIHKTNYESVIETYEMMSAKWFTHGSPTLYNAGTVLPSLSSCFLATVKSDSIDGIYETLKDCALISKHAGGIGFNLHNVRGKGMYIAGTNGTSDGIVPMLKVYEQTAKHVNEGGNKRPGAFAAYLEPWHTDTEEFVRLRHNQGSEDTTAKDLFLGLWINDLFMERVEKDQHWTLMSEVECPGLSDAYGKEFEELYVGYEKRGLGKQIMARSLWKNIITMQIECGVPYMCYKDSVNKKSNQKNLGTIKGSNLCTEIMEYSSPDEIAVCNLASVNLSLLADYSHNEEEMKAQLKRVVDVVTRNLDQVIDRTCYPVEAAKRSNMRHRPMGIGVQGLADLFAKLELSFTEPRAKYLNKLIFETIYFQALTTSCELAKEKGPYSSFEGSPASQGILQYDMWDVDESTLHYEWADLKKEIKRHGLRNSLLVAPMPTASTAQILGNNECFEPFTSNLYTRRVLSGEFKIVNQHLVRDLTKLDLWDDGMKEYLAAGKGSIQNIPGIPAAIKERYKTVWEIKQSEIVKMAADRAPFIDQSQSLNIHIAKPTLNQMYSLHFMTWKLGLKTGMYYLRTKPTANAIQFTLDKELVRDIKAKLEKREPAMKACSRDNREDCEMCSG